MKRPASLLAASLCLMLGAHAARAQSADQTTSFQALPEAERALHDRKVAAGQIIEPLPGESQSAFHERARTTFARLPRSTGQSSAPAPLWPDDASSPSSSASTRPSSRRAPGFGIVMLFMFALVFLGLRKMYRGVFRLARVVSASTPSEDRPPRELDHMFFDQHVAKRLAELQTPAPAAVPADSGRGHHTVPPMPTPAAARGFGRKV